MCVVVGGYMLFLLGYENIKCKPSENAKDIR